MSYESLTEAGTVLGSLYIRVDNGANFYRPDNASAWDWAQRIAPRQVDEFGLNTDTPLKVIDGGCSKGRQTWALGALLAAQGIPFTLQGVDVNPAVLQAAEKPYEGTLASLEQTLRTQDLPLGCLDFFERVDAGHVQPTPELRQRVSFNRMNLLTDAFDSDAGHHTVIINNVLMHFPIDEKNRRVRIVLNATKGLVARGVLSINSLDPIPREFAQHGLITDPGLTNPDVRSYNFRYLPNSIPQPPESDSIPGEKRWRKIIKRLLLAEPPEK